MFKTPQKRGGASTLFGSPSLSIPNTKGLFSDRIWNCNCAPRLPATKFQVKKETRNQGRWFYTCQVARDDGGCGFFLWNEDAMLREGKVVLGNLRSEKTPEVGRTPEKNSALREERMPTAGRKRSIQVDLVSEGSEDDEFGSWSLSPTTQNNVVESTDTVPSQATLSPETPRKASKVGLFTTPGSKRKRDYGHGRNEDHSNVSMDGLPTPITDGGLGGRRLISLSEYGNDDEDIFSTPSSLGSPSHNNSFGMRSPSSTPTPFANHFQPPSPTLQSSRQHIPIISSPYDITPDVLNLLQEEDVLLDEETKGKLQNLLGRHAMRVSGIAKGRDITRVALKSKDSNIAELGLRIGQLEAEREVDKRLIAGLRDEKERKGMGRVR